MAILTTVALAAPQMHAALAAPLAPAASPSPSPSPTPTPGIKPSPALHAARGGPLQFSLTGGLSMGSSQRSDAQGDTSNSMTQTTENAGLMARVERDTGSSRLVANMPIGLSFQRGTFGLPQLAYYSPTYGIEYGQQNLAPLGGVPLGSTLRGFSFILPMRGGGETTFFQGPSLGADGETLDLRGALARSEVRGTLLEGGLTTARSAGGDWIDALLFGAARSSGILAQSIEGAFERSATSAPASAFQYVANATTTGLSAALTVRHIGDEFMNFGGGPMDGQNATELTAQRSLGPYNISIDDALQRTFAQDSSETTQRHQLYITRNLGIGSLAFALSDQRQIGTGGVQWQGGPQLQGSFALLGAQLVLGASFTRSTSDSQRPSAGADYTAQLDRVFGPYNFSLQYNSTKQTGDLQSFQGRTLLSFGRTMGRMSFSFNTQLNKIVSSGADTTQFAPTFSVSRQISPALSVGMNYGVQFSHDPVNPAMSGHSRIFGVQIAAPFALGNGVVQGRADPRLPATISGSVMNESSGTQLPFGAGVGNGLPNIEVVLDNQTVARTDLSGHFQFNTVTAGLHQVRVEAATLPRGVLVDQPYASVNIMGGQQVTLNFGVGSFGVIQGHVMGSGPDGEQIPLDNVTIALDGERTTQTDVYGGFGFGRLTPGMHNVEIVAGSLPASVGFPASETKKSVSVETGQVTGVDFTASPLGSISGKVTFDKLLAPQFAGGVYNAYVVAEPGDYAVITDVDGSYYMDNLPQGTYTIDVDPETVPPNTGTSAPLTVVLGGGAHEDNVDLTVGRKQKAIVFTFQSGQSATVAALDLSERDLPPYGATQVSVTGADGAKTVAIRAFGHSQALHYDERSKTWIGMVDVPPKTPKGDATLVAEIDGKLKKDVTATLSVDPDTPLVKFTMIPRYPRVGQTVSVRARFLTEVAAGDRIRWLDGQITQLSRPVTGRVYQFTVKISEQPMRGFLLTRQGELPITLR